MNAVRIWRFLVQHPHQSEVHSKPPDMSLKDNLLQPPTSEAPFIWSIRLWTLAWLRSLFW